MEMNFASLGAFLSLGLAALWTVIWEWILAKKSVDILGKNPNMYSSMLIYTVLGIALVESSAIYGLVVAMQILSTEWKDAFIYIFSGLTIGVLGFWVAVIEGIYVSSCLEAMNRNPENKTRVLNFMVLFVALLESSAIYWIVLSFKILG